MTTHEGRAGDPPAQAPRPLLAWGLRTSVFGLTLVTYIITLCPTCGPGDASEFATSGTLLGISHPPGYPLYNLLSRLSVMLLPVGNPAARVNLLSALFGAMALALLYEFLRVSLRSLWFPWFACLILGFSRAWWLASTTAEVYATHGFFLALLLWLALRAGATFSSRSIGILIYTLGLGLTHHSTIVLAVPALALAIGKKRWDWRTIVLGSVAFLIPLTLYAYIPLRAAEGPAYAFGNPEGIAGFWRHVTAAGYRGNLLPAGWETLAAATLRFPRHLSEGIPAYLLWAPVIGILKALRRYRRFVGMMGLFAVPYVCLVLVYAIPDIGAYFLPIHMTMAALTAVGLQASAGQVCRWIGVPDSNARRWVSALIPAAGVGIVVCVFLTNLPWCDRSTHRLAEQYGRSLLKTVEVTAGENGILLLLGDHAVFPCAYLKLVEGAAPGVTVYDQSGSILEDLYGDRADRPGMSRAERAGVERDLLLRHPGSVFYSQKERVADAGEIPYRAVGLLFHPKAEPPSAELLEQIWASYPFPDMGNPHLYADISSRVIGGVYFQARALWDLERNDRMRAVESLRKAGEIAHDVAPVQARQIPLYLSLGDLGAAIRAAERALELSPGSTLALNSVGNVYCMARRWDDAEAAFEKALRRDPHMAVLHANLAAVHFARGEPEASLADLERALALDPHLVNARYNRALALFRTGRRDAAMAELARVIEEQPTHALGSSLMSSLEGGASEPPAQATMMLTFAY